MKEVLLLTSIIKCVFQILCPDPWHSQLALVLHQLKAWKRHFPDSVASHTPAQMPPGEKRTGSLAEEIEGEAIMCEVQPRGRAQVPAESRPGPARSS